MNKGYMLAVSIMVLMGCESTSEPAVSEQALLPMQQIREMAGHYERAGEHDKALVYYLKALESAPEDTELTYRVAQLHKRMGKPEFALHMLERVIAADAQHSKALTEAAMLFLENKQLSKAAEYFSRVTVLDQRRLSAAESEAGGYAGLDEDSPVDAYNGLGVAYDLLGRYDEAQAMYELCLKVAPRSPIVLTNKGYSHYLSGSYQAAVNAFLRAIESDPGYRQSWTNLGLVYARMGRYNKAFQTLTRVMSEAQAYNDLGYFLMLEHRYEEAEYFLEQAIEMSPKYYQVAHDNLNDVRHHLANENQAGETLIR